MKTHESTPAQCAWAWLLGGWLFTSSTLYYWQESPQPNYAPVPRVVDLSTSSARELRQLPGIGALRAAAIVELRWQRGPRGFELGEIPGIGSQTEARVKEWLESASGSGPSEE